MAIIEVDRLSRNFRYYEKQEGLGASLRNLVTRTTRDAQHGVQDPGAEFHIELGAASHGFRVWLTTSKPKP
jgi:ABC-type uncharacterized transport system ATPase subunit